MSENNDKMDNLNILLDGAEDLTGGGHIYSNASRVSSSTNEVILDLYYLLPNPQKGNKEVQAKFQQRVIMPLQTAKELGNILLNSAQNWEEKFGVSIEADIENILEDMEEGSE